MGRPAKRRPVKPTVILDPGSCHDGSLSKATELIHIASGCGADAIKFQLLSPAEEVGGNIGMDWDWLPKLMVIGECLGIEVFASVFDVKGIEWVTECGCKSIKFAYSQQALYCDQMRMKFDTTYISCDVMNLHVNTDHVHLYCIPLYPVPYIVDFAGLFPRFEGFSDHTLNYGQTLKAVRAGAMVIEKHIQGDWDSPTPDARFALRPRELRQLMRKIK